MPEHDETIILGVGESETFSELQSEVIFLGVRNIHFLLCLVSMIMTFGLVLVMSNYLFAIPASIVVFLALFRKCQEMCKINPYWLEYMTVQNYGNRTWIGG